MFALLLKKFLPQYILPSGFQSFLLFCKISAVKVAIKNISFSIYRYDSIPDSVKNSSSAMQHTIDTNASMNIKQFPSQELQKTPGSVLVQYLFNQRWVWSVGSIHNVTIDASSIAQMLEAITKYVLKSWLFFLIFVFSELLFLVIYLIILKLYFFWLKKDKRIADNLWEIYMYAAHNL